MPTMGKDAKSWHRLETLADDLMGFHALFLAVIRFAVGKYGGTVFTDLSSGVTQLHIPDWAQETCLEDLGKLVGPGKPLNAYWAFLTT
jgi:hypothetical protein